MAWHTRQQHAIFSDVAVTILSIGLLVFAGHFLTGFFERTKVPDVLILMLAGIVLGPVFHVVTPEDFGKVGPVFTTLALIIILFEGGIHLNIRDLGAAAGDTLVISLATFALTVLLVTYAVDLLLPVDPFSALLIGMILGGTSSAVVVPLIRILSPADRPRTVLLLESALTDVLAVVLSLGLMRALVSDATFSAGLMTKEVASSFLIAALIGAVGAFIWSAILDKIRQLPNTVFTTVAYVLILYGVTEWWGYSGAIASLSFGIAVANLPNIPERILGKVISFRLVGFADVERTLFAEAVFLVKTFFFVFLGISISFADWRIVTVGLTAALVAVLGRALMVRLLVPKSVTRRDALLMTALIPKGLAAAVLAALPVQRGLPDGEAVQGTVYAVIFFSIALCAVLIFAIESGRLNGLAGFIFRPLPLTPPEGTVTKPPMSSFEQSLGLPALRGDWQEPNPVRISEEPPGREADTGDPPASPESD